MTRGVKNPERPKVAALHVMTAEEFTAWRVSSEMKRSTFGAHLGDLLGRNRGYTPQELAAWEKGTRAVPESVQRVYWQLQANAATTAAIYRGRA